MSEPKSTAKPYPEVQAQASFPAIEQEVLARWQEQGTFRKSVEQRAAGANEYVFSDGPPFANGQPHYGHLLTGFVKDVVPRDQTMRGRRVERRFGWDCHVTTPSEVMPSSKTWSACSRPKVTNKTNAFG